MEGYVYVLENESFEGLCKIGLTTDKPEVRAKALCSTGVPTPFSVVYAVKTHDCCLLESRVHQTLDAVRVAGKEFFRVTKEAAVDAVTTEANKLADEKMVSDEEEKLTASFTHGVYFVVSDSGWHGFFGAKNVSGLFWRVDEFMDPYLCKFRKISPTELCFMWKKDADGGELEMSEGLENEIDRKSRWRKFKGEYIRTIDAW